MAKNFNKRGSNLTTPTGTKKPMKSDTPHQPTPEELSCLIPTPENVKIEDPKLRQKVIERSIADKVNESSQLQQTILEAQMRIAANNLNIEALVSKAKDEGYELEFGVAPEIADND